MKKIKRILAAAGLVIIMGMYLMTFIFALTSAPGADKLFLGSLVVTIIVPVIIYAYSIIYKMAYKDKDKEPDNRRTRSKKAFDEAIK